MTKAGDLHQRGLAEAAAGRLDQAAELMRSATVLEPEARIHWTNLGLALARMNRSDEAVEAYRSALGLDPGHASTLAKLGRVLTQAGRYEEALVALGLAVATEPLNADMANALGAALAASGGREAEARAAFRRAVDLDASYAEAWRNLGLLEAQLERWRPAADALRIATNLEPDSAGSFYRLGVSLARLSEHEESVGAYRSAIQLEPEMAEGWNNLGHQLAALGRPAEALPALERALAVRPNYVDARYNLGVTLQSLGRSAEARRAYQLVLAAGGGHADALNNLGSLCLADAEPRPAIALYERALAANGAHGEARWNLGLAQLSIGEWEKGWANYEARPLARRFDVPRWRQGLPLEGRSVLTWCEQGLGDGIQFARYALALRRLGAARIAVECPDRLAGLLGLAEGIDAVISRGSSPPFAVDYQVSLMSLPFELGTRPETVPPSPDYLLPVDRKLAWRARCNALGGRVAGIVWGGNPNNRSGLNRSMPLEVMVRLAGLTGLTLVSLQHGPQRSELAAWPEVLDWPQNDLVDTAALVSELDVVITVDTLMAHLAGTVGRAVYLMTPLAADWRWMTDRSDSLWYPRLRLFRQTRRGDWAGVIERVAEALNETAVGLPG